MSSRGDRGPTDGDGIETIDAVFDHAAVAAPRLRDLLPIYHELLGGTFLNGGDNLRVGYRALQVAYPDGSKIELMEPLRGSTFFDSFVASKGWGLHHVTFKVADIRGTIAVLEERGFTLAGVFLDDEFWKEAFLHPRQAGGTLVQLAETGPGYPPPQWDTTLEEVLAGRGDQGNNEPSP